MSLISRSDRNFGQEIKDLNLKSKQYCEGNNLLFVDNVDVEESCLNNRANITSELVPAFRKSHPQVFLGKGVLKAFSKHTGEHPSQSVISIKVQSNF